MHQKSNKGGKSPNRTGHPRPITVGKKILGEHDETSVTTTMPNPNKLAQANAVRQREQGRRKGGRKVLSQEELLERRRREYTETDEEIKARILGERK